MWILRTWGAGVLRPYARKTNEEKPKTQVKNRYLGHPNPGKRQTQDPGTNSVPGAPKPKKEQTQERTNPSKGKPKKRQTQAKANPSKGKPKQRQTQEPT